MSRIWPQHCVGAQDMFVAAYAVVYAKKMQSVKMVDNICFM